MDRLLRAALEAAERGWIPDALVRLGIRRLCAQRLADERASRLDDPEHDDLVRHMSDGPIAMATADANAQHYAQPAELFARTLGPRLKYSCCYWPEGTDTLEEAEEASLDLTCQRARIVDGMDILELGCGWGSLTLWMAKRFPNSRITAVSNSAQQRHYIAARSQGLGNVRVVTADINDFDHMHNYRELLRRISVWMRPNGLLFFHVFAHKRYAYKYELQGSGNWMARNFFTGGVMPSFDLFRRFQEDLQVLESWWWSGRHYNRTAEAWLSNMERNKASLLEILTRVHGSREAGRWYQRWRMFYLACAELWGFRKGEEWGVAHYLFERRTLRGRTGKAA
jgi:cyclopropane-fatty-acyl-phospholipid synthase